MYYTATKNITAPRMIYGLPKPSPARERRITMLLLFVYAAITALLFYHEHRRQNMAETKMPPGRNSNTIKSS